jgi:uncharacterized protein
LVPAELTFKAAVPTLPIDHSGNRRALLRAFGDIGVAAAALALPGVGGGAFARSTRGGIRREGTAMSEFTIWRRLDQPGHDAALLTPTDDGWLLRGTTVFGHPPAPSCINYSVLVDSSWRTRSGTVQGFHGARSFAHSITHTVDGWHLDGTLVKGLEHLHDLDYGFTPATNMLQLRRVNIASGEDLSIPVAWFDEDATTLTELPQRYRCLNPTTLEYNAPTVGYRGQLTLASPRGFVKDYPRLWIIET